MTVHLKKTIPAGATPISAIDRAGFAKYAASLPAASREWLKTIGFTGAAYSHALLPGVGAVVAIASLRPDEGGVVPKRRRHGDCRSAGQFSDEKVWAISEISRRFQGLGGS